jgi:hypothetical protein
MDRTANACSKAASVMLSAMESWLYPVFPEIGGW